MYDLYVCLLPTNHAMTAVLPYLHLQSSYVTATCKVSCDIYSMLVYVVEKILSLTASMLIIHKEWPVCE